MLTNIKNFVDNSETLKEARINVKDTSLIKEIGIFIVLFLVLFIAMAIFEYIFTKIGGSGFNARLFALCSFFVVPIIVYLFATKIEKRSWRSIGFSKGNAIPQTLKGLLIGFVMFLVVVIIGFLLGQFRFDGFDFSQAIYIVPFLIAFAIQSFGEEIYTRGWTLTYFSKRHSVLIGILVSNIIFIFPHLGNSGIDLLSIINIFLCGTVFALLFLRFDNIWICGGAHTAWNFSQGVLFGFNVSGFPTPCLLKCSQVGQNIINGGAFGPESSLISTFVLIITAILIVYYVKK